MISHSSLLRRLLSAKVLVGGHGLPLCRVGVASGVPHRDRAFGRPARGATNGSVRVDPGWVWMDALAAATRRLPNPASPALNGASEVV